MSHPDAHPWPKQPTPEPGARASEFRESGGSSRPSLRHGRPVLPTPYAPEVLQDQVLTNVRQVGIPTAPSQLSWGVESREPSHQDGEVTARTLFLQPSLPEYIGARRQAALDEARRLDDQALLYEDLTVLAGRLAERHRLVTPALERPVIDGPRSIVLSPQDLRGLPGLFSLGLPVPREGYRGTQMRVLVPFQGTAELFEYRPSHFSTNPPYAQLDKAGHQLIFTDRFLEGQYNPAAYLPTVASKTEPSGGGSHRWRRKSGRTTRACRNAS